jgi:hypothetical protein
VPYSVGDGELRIVASQDLGQLGPPNGPPVVFRWRWYYHVPLLPLWAIMLLLLIVPKTNRHFQAWLILIPLGVVLLVPRMLTTLFAAPDQVAELLTYSVASFAMAWSVVWLVGHWLAFGSRKITLLLIMVATSAIGVFAAFCRSGNIANSLSYSISYGVVAVALSLGMMLAGYSCRKKWSPRRYRVWLLLWTVASMMVATACFAAIMLLIVLREQFAHAAPALLFLIPISAIYGVVLYLVNLPFQELAFRCPFYRERFEKLFHIEKTPEVAAGCPFAEQGPSSPAGR